MIGQENMGEIKCGTEHKGLLEILNNRYILEACQQEQRKVQCKEVVSKRAIVVSLLAALRAGAESVSAPHALIPMGLS